MDKQAMIRNFTRCAYAYDRYADVQKRVALQLIEQIEENNLARILEIGCGTGNYTLLLRDRFKKAKLRALDISGGMIEVARLKLQDKGIEFIVADAERIYLNEDFDLITSNACFQWFYDLEETLLNYRAMIKDGGGISFSIFGPLTFWELNTSLENITKNASIVAGNFITKDRIKEILNKNFRQIKIDEVRYEQTHHSLRDLLNKIKYTGTAGNAIINKNFFTAQFLDTLEESYLGRFKQIQATYQIFFCHGKKV